MKLDHFKHVDPKPNFHLFPDDPPVPAARLEDGVASWTLGSGDLSAEITQNPYTITFRSPQRILTTSGVKHQAIYDVPHKWTLRSASNGSCLATDFSSNPHPELPPENVRYTSSELNLSPGELIYGLGEQFGAFVKNGASSCRCSMRTKRTPCRFRPVCQHLEPRRGHVQRTGVQVCPLLYHEP